MRKEVKILGAIAIVVVIIVQIVGQGVLVGVAARNFLAGGQGVVVVVIVPVIGFAVAIAIHGCGHDAANQLGATGDTTRCASAKLTDVTQTIIIRIATTAIGRVIIGIKVVGYIVTVGIFGIGRRILILIAV